MHLKNKQSGLTGKLTFLDFNIDVSETEIDLTILLDNEDGKCIDRQFYSLDELKEFLRDWKELKEPLIKDEKIRKALRAVYDASPHRDNVVYFDGRWTFRGDKFEVMFDDREIKIEGWTDGKAYHIEELCGEEEDDEVQS